MSARLSPAWEIPFTPICTCTGSGVSMQAFNTVTSRCFSSMAASSSRNCAWLANSGVPGICAGGDQHHDHAAVRQQPHPSVFQNGLAQRWRYDNPQPVGDFRQHVSRAFGDLCRAGRATHLPLNPLAISDADGCLRSNFLRKETIGCRGWHAPCRCMRLVQKSSVLQVRHDVPNRRRAQGLFEALGNRARGDRLAGLNVRAHKVRENLAVAPFLKRRIPHSSTLLPVPKSATQYCRKGVKNRQRECPRRSDIINLRALELVGVIDVHRLPFGEEINCSNSSLAVYIDGLFSHYE